MATGDKLIKLDALKAVYDNQNSNIAPTEASSTASEAHAAGSYFIYNGTLYRATADIASGGTITPNTNCVAVTVGAEVSELKSALNHTVLTLTFTRGSIGDDGALHPDPETITRCYSPRFTCPDSIISIESGYEYIRYEYLQDGTFVGRIDSSWKTTPSELDGTKSYRIQAKKTGDSIIQDNDLKLIERAITIYNIKYIEDETEKAKGEIESEIDQFILKTDNLFNNVFEQGSIGNSGTNIDTETIVHRSLYIPVKPSTTYTLKCFFGDMSKYVVSQIYEYNQTKAFLGKPTITEGTRYSTFTTQNNTAYIRFRTSYYTTLEGAEKAGYMLATGTEPSEFSYGIFKLKDIADKSIQVRKIDYDFNIYEQKQHFIFDNPSANDGTDLNGFDADDLTAAQVYDAYDALVTSLPGCARSSVLGKDQSGTYDVKKYEFYTPYTSISDESAAIVNANPNMGIKVILTSGTHGNGEYGDNTDSIISVYKFIKDIYTTNQYDSILTWLKNNVQFIVIPCVNPWGITNKSRYNSRDVDINRNFPNGWTNLEPHPGDNALSEKESQYIDAIFQEYSDAHLHLEVHTRGGDSYAGSTPTFLSVFRADCPLIYAAQHSQGFLVKYFNASAGIHTSGKRGAMDGTSWGTYHIPAGLLECAYMTEDGGSKHSARCDQMDTSFVGDMVWRLLHYVLHNQKIRNGPTNS